MKILSIETSCDETAVSIVEANGELESPTFGVLGNALNSQIELHKEYGGVYPMLAKRKHAENLPHLLEKVLKDANMFVEDPVTSYDWNNVESILAKEEGLHAGLKNILQNIQKPNLDVIAVTSGPGLAPALWVGISCAKALGKLWNIPVIGVNHMEGHLTSILIENSDKRAALFPALALLISGGHTELVEIKNWGTYKILGETRDDAVGEAFDKTARMLGLPYPGGPEISRLAEYARLNDLPHTAVLPRPMINSRDLNFSFSGLKTSVLYYIRDNVKGEMSEDTRADLAREFEDAVVEVLLHKTKTAIEETGAQMLIIAGGVIANKKIREVFQKLEEEYPGLVVKVPTNPLSTDNALMIAAAAYIDICINPKLLSEQHDIRAEGNLRL
jgi:N6-L-threonylcarbamoyladenine synthase